ncbi:hypothetical protein [Polymorphum gilvum]|uniref:Uncharacterized protein n=1 Tax=Polymorphum gilvum (strain LMG 25793 / CGMCC 1.9160 / SL003B-26A1) TaxID=991905 RepID=F2J4F4_POLGS|nr:hypothetical protein [Polymorphum gilvum]ADZ71096.1 hypothetical protein SL003B_2673 [Polymorphum gilvum SL003B-26A1]
MIGKTLTGLAMALAAAAGGSGGASRGALAQPVDCHAYAMDHADRFTGDGDTVGAAIEGGMEGAVAGGSWAGPGGARRGARTGAALGVLGTMGADPRVWQGLYDTAYQSCLAQQRAAGGSGGTSASGCRSSATVSSGSSGTVSTRSGGGDCR